MKTFQDFDLPKSLQKALDQLCFVAPTPIQAKSFSVILSGRDNNKLSNLSNKLYGESHIIWSCDFVNENISESFESFLRESEIKINHFLYNVYILGIC